MPRLLLPPALCLIAACAGGSPAVRPAPTATAAAPGSPAAEGDALWARRGERASLEAALGAWQRALATEPDSVDLLVKLARGEHFRAEAFLRADRERQLSAYERGVDFGERALLAASPAFKRRVHDGEQVKDAVETVGQEGVAALYWYGTNLGKWAKAKGFAATLGNKDTVRLVMERCLALDPAFFYGGPDRYFGVFFAVAPSFAGGDLGRSEEHFRRSLQLAPAYLATKVLMAENLAAKAQDRALYVRLLEEVLAASDDVLPGLEPEARVEKAKAAELLQQVDERF